MAAATTTHEGKLFFFLVFPALLAFLRPLFRGAARQHWAGPAEATKLHLPAGEALSVCVCVSVAANAFEFTHFS